MKRFFTIIVSFVGVDASAASDEGATGELFRWLQEELLFFNDGVRWEAHFYLDGAPIVVGSEKELERAPEWCRKTVIEDGDLKGFVASCGEGEETSRRVQNVFVLVRPSWLFRPFGLMQRAIDTFVYSGKPTVSASRTSGVGWRELSLDGSWKAADERSGLFVDDRLMVFSSSQVDEAFDCTTEHSIVETGFPDLLRNRVFSQEGCVLPHSAESCILVGSGLDLAGRKLGAQIDAGVFGKVFRVNRLYGSPQDVGVRTDGFFSFGIGHFLDVDTLNRFGRVLPCEEMVYVHTAEEDCPIYKEIVERYPRFERHPSTGFHVVYALMRWGYLPTVVGYGFKNGKRWSERKFYHDGTLDKSESGHDFEHENQLLMRFAEEGRIVLL